MKSFYNDVKCIHANSSLNPYGAAYFDVANSTTKAVLQQSGKNSLIFPFGKKAISYWNYFDNSKENCARWNKTQDDIKRQILEKWFPIGMEVYKLYSDGNKTGTIYVITEWTNYTHLHLGVKVTSKV